MISHVAFKLLNHFSCTSSAAGIFIVSDLETQTPCSIPFHLLLRLLLLLSLQLSYQSLRSLLAGNKRD